MTLDQLEQDCYRRMGFNTSSPDTATQTRLRAFINESQQEILSEPGFEALLNDTVTFPSVASTPEYSLPPTIARVKAIREATNLITLSPLSLGEYRALYPSPTILTGTPTRWVDLGYSAVATQPSDASQLFFISDSASDGATKTVFVEGYITGGYVRTASVAMNGITGVSLGASITNWIEITKFYVALAAGGTTTAAGNITLNEDTSAGTELARIPIGGSYARYRRIALVPCPASAITYTVDLERDALNMAQATDEPLLPPRFHRLLATGARMKEYEKQDQQRYLLARTEFKEGLKKLKFYLFSQAAGDPNLRGPMSHARRPSQLGGYYPAGT